MIESEIAKLGTLEPASSEFNVCRTPRLPQGLCLSSFVPELTYA